MSRPIIDETIREFLHNKVNSFVKWDLIRFFHDNPHTQDTIENIAHYIGRDVQTIQPALNDLVKAKVLAAETVSDVTVYRLVADEPTNETISRFMEACHDRHFRAEAIHHLIAQQYG